MLFPSCDDAASCIGGVTAVLCSSTTVVGVVLVGELQANNGTRVRIAVAAAAATAAAGLAMR